MLKELDLLLFIDEIKDIIKNLIFHYRCVRYLPFYVYLIDITGFTSALRQARAKTEMH